MSKIKKKLKGNKKHSLESWRFQKGDGDKATVVKVSERPAFFVSVRTIDKDGSRVVGSKVLHSERAVNGVLKASGIKKPTYPHSSVRHADDVAFRKKKMKSFDFQKQ